MLYHIVILEYPENKPKKTLTLKNTQHVMDLTIKIDKIVNRQFGMISVIMLDVDVYLINQ